MSIQPQSPENPGLIPTTTPLAIGAVVTALFIALPELMLINLELWATVAGAVWAFGSVTHLGEPGYIGTAIVLGLPALWASGQTIRMALRAQDTPTPDREWQ